MVKHLSSSMRLVIQNALALSLVCALSIAHAEQFADPTRPPESMGMGALGEQGVSSAPMLQSVLISPERRLAIINGKTLKQGEKFGNATVTKITETEVVLQNGKDKQTLKLFPDIQKRIASDAGSGKAGHRR
jgi:MSHA biogenesis protein MshK